MQVDNYNPKPFLQLIRLIYFALIAGVLFFLLITLLMPGQSPAFRFDTGEPLSLVVPVITLIAIPSGYFFSRRVFNSVRPESLMNKKLSVYQLGLLIRMAFFEGAALLSIVSFMITMNFYFLIFTGLALTAMIINYPTPEKIEEAVSLNPAEKEKFYN